MDVEQRIRERNRRGRKEEDLRAISTALEGNVERPAQGMDNCQSTGRWRRRDGTSSGTDKGTTNLMRFRNLVTFFLHQHKNQQVPPREDSGCFDAPSRETKHPIRAILLVEAIYVGTTPLASCERDKDYFYDTTSDHLDQRTV